MTTTIYCGARSDRFAYSWSARAAAWAFLLALPVVQALGQPAIVESHPARSVIDSSGFAGTILVYDIAEEQYVAGYRDRVHRRLMPASTFKILNALIAIETGVVEDGSTIIEWDGVSRDRPELNRDLDLATAFRISAVPHFQELARRIGAERMKEYVDAVGYGNRDISGGVDRFWLTGSLRISPAEQVEFIRRLQNDDLPFSSTTMTIVKEIMINESTPI
ncbi:MAG: class D beta-lactamase, partial [Rhodothermia bacterium]|nr:class D beta-lactamase [Rhodothermia bacterium]